MRAAVATLLATFAILAALPNIASADPGPAPSEDDRLRVNLPVDLSLTLAGGTAWLVSEYLKASIAPDPCRWCDRTADGADSINTVDANTRAALRWSRPGTAAIMSDVGAFGLVPLAAVGLGAAAALDARRPGNLLVDLLLILESAVIAADLNQLVKFIAGRERPLAHDLDADAKRLTAKPDDNNLSFYSGHTSFTFALAVSAGTVATLRRYRLAPLVWAVGVALAAGTSYLRMAADKHWLSDVLVGAGLGAAVGITVPWLHRTPAAAAGLRAGLAPTPGGATLTVGGQF